MTMKTEPVILIVEDDKTISKFMKISLKAQGYKCIDTETGKNALALIFSQNPNIIILDLGLPDIDGLEVIEQAREYTDSPIIVVSARDHEREKVEALDMGADDYLTKPFSLAELLARVRVAIRHYDKKISGNTEKCEEYIVGDLKMDFAKHKVYIENKEIHLTPIEYKIMRLLTEHSAKVLTHNFIVKEIWGVYSESDNRSLRVFMANIRRKIEKDTAQPRYILTEVGIGYRLADE